MQGHDVNIGKVDMQGHDVNIGNVEMQGRDVNIGNVDVQGHDVNIAALLNDTVGAMAAARYSDGADARIAVVNGTGIPLTPVTWVPPVNPQRKGHVPTRPCH